MTLKNKTTITAKPGSQELFITREFEAPRELVFKAYTDVEIYAQWLGPMDWKHGLKYLNQSAAVNTNSFKKIKTATNFHFTV